MKTSFLYFFLFPLLNKGSNMARAEKPVCVYVVLACFYSYEIKSTNIRYEENEMDETQ